MSISDPLIKELKGHILEATKVCQNDVVAVEDKAECLLPLCQAVEAIFRKGLNHTSHSAFGLTRRDYWSWLEKTATSVESGYKESVEAVTNSPCVSTMQGRGRLFIRHALVNKCLHVPVEIMVRSKGQESYYDHDDSIIGNEILGEIFLSLLYQCAHIKFDLQLDNASFLDDTWHLPSYHQFSLVPCRDLGVYLGHVSGRAVVVRVEEGSVAAEDNKLEVGDIITGVFGICIHGWRRGRVSSLLRQKKGMPITLQVIKGHDAQGVVFPGVVPLLQRLQVDVTELQEKYQGEASLPQETSDTPLIPPLGGQSVEYLGSLSVGGSGDVTHIEQAVSAVVNQDRQAVPVAMVTGEIGVQTLLTTNRKIILSHSYTEISSCGRRNDMPEYFAYIAGDTSCSISSHFTCFVFKAPTVDQSRDILLTLADGFHRTHWAV